MFPVHLLSHKYANDTWEGRHFPLDSHLKIKIIFLTIELRTTPLPSKTIVSQICGWHDISSVHGNKLKRKNCGHFVATLHMYTTCRWFWQSFTYVSENMDETIQKCLTYRYMWGEARRDRCLGPIAIFPLVQLIVPLTPSWFWQFQLLETSWKLICISRKNWQFLWPNRN